jgi:hypothetical protein
MPLLPVGICERAGIATSDSLVPSRAPKANFIDHKPTVISDSSNVHLKNLNIAWMFAAELMEDL